MLKYGWHDTKQVLKPWSPRNEEKENIETLIGKESVMKKKTMLRILISIFLAHSVNSFCAAVTITDVQISPDNPSINDSITIETEGYIGGGTLFLDESVFAQDEFTLQLDLYFFIGAGPQIPQPWFHDEEIGILSQGSYDLSVQAYLRNSSPTDYILTDTYPTNFEVIPEPLTLALLALGSLFIRTK